MRRTSSGSTTAFSNFMPSPPRPMAASNGGSAAGTIFRLCCCRNYLQALLLQAGERRNAENLSESVSVGVSARALQRFLTEARWYDDAVVGACRSTRPPGWLTLGRCGCSAAATSPGRAVNRREWPVSTAEDWGRWQTAKPGCSWHTSAHWGGLWCTNGCICPKASPPTPAAVRRRVCRKTSGTTVWPLGPSWTSPAYQGFGRPRKLRLADGQRQTMVERTDEVPKETGWRLRIPRAE